MFRLLKQLLESFLRNIGGGLGKKLRYWYYRTKFKSCGKNIIIEEGVFFENAKHISLGDNVWIDKNVILIAGEFKPNGRKYHRKGDELVNPGDLIISNNVHVAPFVLIQAHGGVKIGEDVTIACGSKIYSLSHHYKNLNDQTDIKRYAFSTMAKKEDQFLIVGNVIVGDKAAVSINAVLLPGSKIPYGTWIGVSSLVKDNEMLEENSIFLSNN